MTNRFVEVLESRQFLAADLTGTFKTLTLPSSQIAGEAAKGNAVITVRNTDTEALARNTKANVTVALRPAGTAGESDIVIGTASNQSLAGLAGSKTKNVQVKLAAPTTVAEGTYSVVAIVDSSNAVAEADETNNTAAASSQVTVAPSTANIAVTTVTSNLTSKAKSKTAQVKLTNTGNQKVKGKVTVQIVAQQDGQPEQVLGTLSNQNVTLNPNQSFTKPVKITTPAAGTYTIVARVTPDLSPADSNAADNSVTAGPITITAPNGGGSNNGGGGGTNQGTDYFASLGVGNTVTFTKTGSLPGDGTMGAVMETGTFTDNQGKSGTYQLVLTPPIAQGGLKNNILNMDWNDPNIQRGFEIEFRNKAARGNGGFNGRSLVFTPSAAKSIATVKVNPTGSPVFYMKNA